MSNEQGSERRSKPAPQGAPLGQLPIIQAWVEEQERQRRLHAQAQPQARAAAHDAGDDFDLPIPGFEEPTPARAAQFGTPPTATRSLSTPAAARFDNPTTQRHSLLPNSRPPAARPSLTPPRASAAPQQRASQAPVGRSLAPGRPSTPPADDPRWVFGRALLNGGRKGEALHKLEELYYAQPEHELCRFALLDLYIEMRNWLNVAQHADWVVLRQLQSNRASEACELYRLVRTSCPDLAWSERTLAMLTVAGDKLRNAAVVADATRQLVHGFPGSHFLPRALFATASYQIEGGRADLARATLQHLTVSFPMDAVTPLAAQKLRELGSA